MRLKDYANLKEMLIDFNEYSTDYTKTRCKELEETIGNTLKEIERLNNIIKEAKEFIYKNAYDEEREHCVDDLWGEIPKLLEILEKENENGNSE